jgi:prepilin-type processing-associated H-X9-DG protein
MFAIADARMIGPDSFLYPSGAGPYYMPGDFAPIPGELQPLRHGKGFNFVFCDGHVSLVRRTDFMNPSNSWQNWNNDHQPHSETWPNHPFE